MAPAKRTAAAKKAPAEKASPVKKAAVKKAAAKKPARRRGRASIVAAVRKHIEALRREQQMDTYGEVMAQTALTLAAQLDAGDPPTMTVTWARELRQTLDAMTAKAVPADDDPDDPDAWLDGLSPTVRNPEES